MMKSNTHFLEPVPLPPEDVDVRHEIIIKEEHLMKPEQSPMSSDQSPIILQMPGNGRTNVRPKAPRKKRQSKAALALAAAAASQPPPPAIPSPSLPPQMPPVPSVRVGHKLSNYSNIAFSLVKEKRYKFESYFSGEFV